jgi:hypothetical protein
LGIVGAWGCLRRPRLLQGSFVGVPAGLLSLLFLVKLLLRASEEGFMRILLWEL